MRNPVENLHQVKMLSRSVGRRRRRGGHEGEEQRTGGSWLLASFPAETECREKGDGDG
jgi:hypothetical protein